MHYLVEFLEKKFPKIVDFKDELSGVEDGAKVNIGNIRQLLTGMRQSLKELRDLLESLKKRGETNAELKQKNATFIETMSQFYLMAEKSYVRLNEMFVMTSELYESLVLLYAEDPKTMSTEEFFGTLAQFRSAFVQAKQENEEAIQRALDAERKEKEKLERLEKLRKKKEEASLREAGLEESGGLDDLISSIRTGKAFGNHHIRERSQRLKRGDRSRAGTVSKSINK